MQEQGQIISFYSYKGGVGRSMAVANIGSLLATRRRDDRPVLLIDWDLEAPGLYTFFAVGRKEPLAHAKGLLDYFAAIEKKLAADPSCYARIRRCRDDLDEVIPMQEYIKSGVLDSLDLMTAGLMNSEYRRKAAGFDWQEFWSKYPAVVHAFRQILKTRYSFVLIDARTGFSDAGGICSAVLPEKLVILFTPNGQALDGSLELARRIVKFREESDDIRPLAIFPLPSRIEDAEMKERETWLYRFEKGFENCFRTIYNEPDCDLTEYFKRFCVRYIPYFAYGEKLVLLTEENRAGSLRRAYDDFLDYLIEVEYPWQTNEGLDTVEV